jgi:predicted transcriptional regulator
MNEKKAGKAVPMRYHPDIVARADKIAERIGESRNSILRAATTLGMTVLEQAKTDDELVLRMFAARKSEK